MAKYYIAHIVNIVELLHKIDLTHRNLRPDNILIDNWGHLKLSDFGFTEQGL